MALFTGHTITPDSALGGTQIQRSLRFAGAANNSLSRTPSSTGNQKVWTWSCWFKRTKLGDGSYNYLLSSYGNNDGIAAIYFDSDNRINTYYDTSGANPYGAVNQRRYRDVSAWMHIVWQTDAINEVQKIWINGVQESLDAAYNPPNFSYTMNQSGQLQTIGGAAWYPSGTGNNNYLAEIHFSDGNKYTPSDFGYTDAQTGQWRPKNGNVIKSNITYGTNGYWLDFRDNTSTTTLGYDYSGNGNHWTLNNMSVASGSDNDSVTDTPTNNFPTLAGDIDDSGNAPSDGNLQGGTAGTSGWRHTRSTVPLPSTGKWYWEYKVPDASANASNGWMTGIAYSNLGFTQDINSNSTGLYGRQTDSKYNNSSGDPVTNSHFTSTSNNDILQYAYDADSQTLFTGRNNTWELSANPSTGANPNWTGVASGGFPMVGSYGSSRYVIINFGQQGFTYTPPTGYASLSGHNRATANAASVVRPQRFFDTLLYTGNGSGQTISGLEFKPDFLWIKSRTSTEPHELNDTVRGTLKSLSSNTATVENTASGRVTSFNDAGYTVGNSGNVNSNSESFIAWCWKGGGTAVSNTDGSITSSVSANQEAGFSICSWTINTSGVYTIGHGLGKAPDWIMMKNRDTTNNWDCYHSYIGNTKRFKLNSRDAGEDYTEPWNDTTPTSSVFTSTGSWLGGDGNKIIAYCWTSIPGYSKMGGYTGNGSSDGPYVHLGFKPAWFLVKADLSESWYLYDNKRDVDNDVNNEFRPDHDYAAGTFSIGDFLSDGIKIRATDSAYNQNGSSYFYIAFAERPSKTIFGLDANGR